MAAAAVPKDEKDEGSMTPGDIKIGSVIPEFTLVCVDGQEHKLSDFRGTKVMLCFYSFATCPMCAYSISNIIGNYKKLAWASKLKVILTCNNLQPMRESMIYSFLCWFNAQTISLNIEYFSPTGNNYFSDRRRLSQEGLD
mmetsp:Transcript_5806/g.14510  ORF Transcript_5806/g.14510 Transcript_5806/m.14510 type:complete len:140 (-) Transcript_5806:774-1193(-)